MTHSESGFWAFANMGIRAKKRNSSSDFIGNAFIKLKYKKNGKVKV